MVCYPTLQLSYLSHQRSSFYFKLYSDDFLDASTSLPHAAALHPTLPGPDRFRLADDANDYTANAVDLSRYSAAVGGESDSLPKQRGAGKFVRLHSYFDKNKTASPMVGKGASGQTEKPTTTVTTTAPTSTVERLGKRPSSSQDGEKTTATKAGIITAEEAGEGRTRSSSPSKTQVTIIAPGEEEEEKEKKEEDDEGATSGPLYGVRPVERSASYAKEGAGDDGDEEAGPMHFATSKARQGAKSLKEISSLFSGEVHDDPDDPDDDDDEASLGEEVGEGVGKFGDGENTPST
jgi:hypothetical protein